MTREEVLERIIGRTIGENYVDCRDLPKGLLQDLAERGSIQTGVNGWYAVTDEGRARYTAAMSRPLKKATTWREEARSGLHVETSKASGFVVTRETRITAAAIPTAGAAVEVMTPEELLCRLRDALKERDRLCRALECSIEELVAAFGVGLVKYCVGGHLGLFDLDKAGRCKKLCRNCLKSRRKHLRTRP